MFVADHPVLKNRPSLHPAAYLLTSLLRIFYNCNRVWRTGIDPEGSRLFWKRPGGFVPPKGAVSEPDPKNRQIRGGPVNTVLFIDNLVFFGGLLALLLALGQMVLKKKDSRNYLYALIMLLLAIYISLCSYNKYPFGMHAHTCFILSRLRRQLLSWLF
jgi:hypothetical protein